MSHQNPEVRALMRAGTKLKGARTNLRHVQSIETRQIADLIDAAMRACLTTISLISEDGK